jgi:hypothetical protein
MGSLLTASVAKEGRYVEDEDPPDFHKVFPQNPNSGSAASHTKFNDAISRLLTFDVVHTY